MILCIGLAADDTFCHTLAALQLSRAAFEVIDFAQLALSGDIDAQLRDPAETAIRLGDRHFRLGAYESAYVRLVNIADEAPTDRLGQRAEALYQCLLRLLSHAAIPILNRPLGDCSNFSKFYHAVALARPRGWQIPRSCLTNQADVAKTFIESCGENVIFKGASGMKTWATPYDPRKHNDRLSLLSTSPVLFQERIEGPDVRVHVVGDRVFAEMIESEEMDYRTTRNNRYHAIVAPEPIGSGCVDLAHEMSCPLVGIDFKVERTTDRWYFLEANTMPCYEGYDRRTGGRISEAVVQWLLPDRMLRMPG